VSATPAEQAAVAELRDPATIRLRCGQVLAAARADALTHFRLHEGRIDAAAERVVDRIWAAYPDLQIPYHSRWRHFSVGGVDRAALLDARLSQADDAERARARFDLTVTSVLLDAGAGPDWSYTEAESQRTFDRSEGLAVASFHMFLAGAFSSDPTRPLRADAAGLRAVTAASVGDAFQVGQGNPLVGLEGRASLITKLGDAVAASPTLFGESPRVGHLYDHLAAQAEGGKLPATAVLAAVLEGFGPIWPGRVELGGVNLGDVWPHPALSGHGPGAGLVPFHKLSQWLTYSLLEPLEWAGITITDLDALTGLPEYRNGGLLVDTGVLEPKCEAVLAQAHLPGSEVIVEWRALTVALLDLIAVKVRELLGLSADDFPLAKVLEGGTWAAGRAVASERRESGGPPIRIQSDGTVF
jgi:hypothetical protein